MAYAETGAALLSARLIPPHRQDATIATPRRFRIEAAIERLLTVLDEIDGDADLDPDKDDEPSLGWPGGDVSRWGGRVSGLEEDYYDCEPQLAEPGNSEGSQA